MSSRVLFVTGSDANQFSLAGDCITSIHQQASHLAYDIAFLDLGCTDDQVAEIQAKGCLVKAVEWEFGIQNNIPQIECRKGQICRPFLPTYFPEHDIFFWIDADAWVQHRDGIDLFLQAAEKGGAGLVPEIERSSKFFHGGLNAYLQSMTSLYQRIYAETPPAAFSHYTNINAGVFCFHRDSHLWDVWKQSLHATLQAFLSRNPNGHEVAAVFGLIDQIALNTGIRQNGLERAIEYLPLTCNWTCHLSLPAYDEASQLLVEPYLPHAPLGIVHLTNPWGGGMAALPHPHERRSRRQRDVAVGKESYRYCRLETTTGGNVVGSLFFGGEASFARCESVTDRPVTNQGAGSRLAASQQYDYVSPGLETIWPDAAFPHMIEGNPDDCKWPYLRKGSPHRWCVDRRFPVIGFVSRDEAALLYNTALRCRGKRGLEIGCWQGWSACHIAAAGVRLDIVDPVLGNPMFRPTIEASFRHAGVIDNLTLHAAPSPDAIAPLAAANAEPWSFFFIDGDHEGNAVLNDTIACVKFAADDCIILFHDLASPDVAKGLQWLQDNGWRTRIYHTAQIMAAAWRGALEPPEHTPDPHLLASVGVPSHVLQVEEACAKQPFHRAPRKSAEQSAAQLSVVIPVYNAQRTVARAVESVCHQNPPPDEVLIIDDCSTDESPTIIEKLSRQFPFIRVHRHSQKAQNWLQAFCGPWATASGKYVVGVGADDVLYPGFTQAVSQVIDQGSNIGVIFADYDYVAVQPSGTKVLQTSTSGYRRPAFLNSDEVIQRTLTCGMHDCGIASAIRTDLLRILVGLDFWKLGPWSDSWGYAAMACLHGAAYIPTALGGFTVRQEEPSYHQHVLADPAAVRICAEACTAFRRHHVFASLPTAIWDALQRRWGPHAVVGNP